LEALERSNAEVPESPPSVEMALALLAPGV
jgi:hypothetical protein